MRKSLSNQISIHQRNLEHVYQWQETVEGENLTVESYDAAIERAGTAASRLSEHLAGVRGPLQARAARARKEALEGK